ncbi:pyridoxal phosphate-dependent aminotransferase [Streptomyces sp. PR69]|uniref:pyridoxal phosphate-dependent aminotransferase n=1 Tax=Streptomyces sp. PR69 TaxID=2984950 RepID=UPI002264A7E3|nr:pyridoxal phosphate-dependent aminotransferase [Streptomyces sp. PR69]
MKNHVATRFSGIKESATYAVLELVRELRAQGLPVLDLGGGEPDFATPRHIVAEANLALDEGFTHYSPSRGLPELLTAISRKLAEDNGIEADPAEGVIVTPSAKHALFITLMTLLDPGDELLVPTPSWVSYQSMAHLAGARPVAVPLGADDGFRITRKALEGQLSPRTKALLVNSPNNPTGRTLDAQEARVIADFVQEHELFAVADEIYEKIRYAGAPHLSIAALPGCAERTVTVNGFSKGYAMTGWRLGYAAGPARIMTEMLKVQQHSVGCAGSFVQRGGLAALTGPQEPVAEMAAAYTRRMELITDGLNSLPGVGCARPSGGFYAFPDIRGTGFASSEAFAGWLLREAHVAVMPGTAFGPGGEGHIRLSFATSEAVIEEALGRMAKALATAPRP